MRGIKLAQKLFKRRLERSTTAALDELTQASSRLQQVSEELEKLGKEPGPKVEFGATQWKKPVALPLSYLRAHGLVLGASGAGKSYFALSVISQFLALSATSDHIPISFGLLDAKGELFEKVLGYLYAHLYRLEPKVRARIAKKIVLIDFSNTAQITPYNILVRQENVADEIMVAGRIETIGEQFSGISQMSVRMRMILKYFLLLLTEYALPLSYFERLCNDPLLLAALVEQSNNVQVKDYFSHRFDGESKLTLLALRQRIDSLLVSEGVRLSLSAEAAPDFASLQDQGAIILINTAGRNITRGISELLQSLILSDIKQSVFRRSNQGQHYLWFFDEAQNLYKAPANREHMNDLLTMARSFNSFFVLLTQSLTSATRDQDILNTTLGNVRWIVMLRSTLRDASLIAPALPLTGSLTKPMHNPFEPPQHLTESEELKLRLNAITKLPDRLAYCWLKANLSKAIKITTPYMPPPHKLAGCSKEALSAFIKSEPLGQGVTKETITRALEDRHQRLRQLLSFPHRKSGKASTSRKAGKDQGKTLVRMLEEEYSTKK